MIYYVLLISILGSYKNNPYRVLRFWPREYRWPVEIGFCSLILFTIVVYRVFCWFSFVFLVALTSGHRYNNWHLLWEPPPKTLVFVRSLWLLRLDYDLVNTITLLSKRVDTNTRHTVPTEQKRSCRVRFSRRIVFASLTGAAGRNG